jgi:hypothetical protein
MALRSENEEMTTSREETMDAHEPLSMTDAKALWEMLLPKLRRRTFFQIYHAYNKRNLPAIGELLVKNEGLIADILDRLEGDFFQAVERGTVWGDLADHWFSRVHGRITKRLADKEAKHQIGRATLPTGSREADEERGSRRTAEIPCPGPSPETLAWQRELVGKIRAYVSKLPPKKAQRFFELVEELSQADVAKRDGLRENTIHVRTARLREELLALIGESELFPCARRRPRRKMHPGGQDTERATMSD